MVCVCWHAREYECVCIIVCVHMLACTCVWACVCIVFCVRVRASVGMHMSRWVFGGQRTTYGMSSLSSHYVDPWDQTRVSRLGGQYLYLPVLGCILFKNKFWDKIHVVVFSSVQVSVFVFSIVTVDQPPPNLEHVHDTPINVIPIYNHSLFSLNPQWPFICFCGFPVLTYVLTFVSGFLQTYCISKVNLC